jgi:hypothetical protein
MGLINALRKESNIASITAACQETTSTFGSKKAVIKTAMEEMITLKNQFFIGLNC